MKEKPFLKFTINDSSKYFSQSSEVIDGPSFQSKHVFAFGEEEYHNGSAVLSDDADLVSLERVAR
jgi:hypothetical protein